MRLEGFGGPKLFEGPKLSEDRICDVHFLSGATFGLEMVL